METEILKPKTQLHPKGRAVNNSLHALNLRPLIKNMKRSLSWAKGELITMILLKSDDKQIILTALHEGTEIVSFQSNDSVTFQIIEGKLNFHTRKENVTLDKGQLLILQDKVRYDLTSLEETVFLLTISRSNSPLAAN
jgi:hypothetical protein